MPKILKPREMNKCLGCFSCMSACSFNYRKDHSLVKSAIRVHTVGGLAGSFIAIVCLGCKEPACMEVCPSNALEPRPGGGVLVKEDKCIGCRKCESACIMQAINFDEETNTPIICRHCGVCTRFCPHDCLQMIESKEAGVYA